MVYPIKFVYKVWDKKYWGGLGKVKIWKLVSGILLMVLFILVEVRSCAAGMVNTIEENGESSGSGKIGCLFQRKKRQ